MQSNNNSAAVVKQCPMCGSTEIHRSTPSKMLKSPKPPVTSYRCAEGHVFIVVGKKADAASSGEQSVVGECSGPDRSDIFDGCAIQPSGDFLRGDVRQLCEYEDNIWERDDL